MLSDSERHQIEEILGSYETRVAAAVEALQIVQAERGWVSDEALADLAGLLQVSPAHLESLATFYSMIFRRPVGRHVIMVCEGVCCWISGAEEVAHHLSSRLRVGFGETTADGRFTLLPVVCLGACDQAPAMMVDWQLHGHLTRAEIDRVLEAYP
jgi:NADH-quinone oxidoreductase subunit E